MLRVNSQKSKVSDQSGFTLVEFLIYSVIVAMFIGLLVLMSVNIIQGNANLNTINEVNNNMRFSLNKMTYYIRETESFLISPDNETLELTLKDTSSVIFKLGGVENDILQIQKGEEIEALIDSEIIKVTSLIFTDVSYPDTPGTIRIELSLKRKNPLNRSQYDFNTTSQTTENLRTY